jgi:hypothetical protein
MRLKRSFGSACEAFAPAERAGTNAAICRRALNPNCIRPALARIRTRQLGAIPYSKSNGMFAAIRVSVCP